MSKKFIVHKSMAARAGAIVAAVALGTTLSAGVAFADDADDATAALIASVSDITSAGLHTDYVGGEASLASTAFPIAFDLRHYGGTLSYDATNKRTAITGGTNYVTPVKYQTPFGTCWAFSVTAASESSLLSSLDKADDGQMNGTVDYEKAASGEAGALAKAASDLSERHLAYFAFAHPTTTGLYPSQAGEGRYFVNGSTDAATIMNPGGNETLALTIYSSGIGPVPESYAPYISDEGWLLVNALEVIVVDGSYQFKPVYVRTIEEGQKYYEENWTEEALTAFKEKYGFAPSETAKTIRVAKIGTWAVDQSKKYGTVAELDNSNVIADKKNADGSLTDSEMAQMKNELSAGRALSILYLADVSQPGQKPTTSTYLNTDTWAQYTYDTTAVNHLVAIVGWDDDYSKDNFTHNIYKKNETTGELVVDEEKTAKTTPAGNGAWICKNSWGSKGNKNPLYENEWGVDGSGYFYISYYDSSLCSTESYEYDVSTEAQARLSYACYQHDLATVISTKSAGTDSVTKECNVFDGPKQGENPVAIRDLGYLSGSVNATTILEVYVMDDSADAATVIANAEPDATITDTSQDTAGFHRVHLDGAVIVNPGQKFAVVQTTKRDNGQYEYSFNYSETQSFVTEYDKAMLVLDGDQLTNYSVAIVNKGESLMFKDGAWQDWKDASAEYDRKAVANQINKFRASAAKFRAQAEKATDAETKAALIRKAEACEAFQPDSLYAIDNWMIKAYGDEVETGKTPVYRLYNPSTTEHLWTTDSNEYKTLTDYGWTQEGVAWRSPSTSDVPMYRLYNPSLGVHHYTADWNEVVTLANTYGWQMDNGGNAVFYSAAETDEGAESVYRLYNDPIAQHLLTMDGNEYGTLPAYGWKQEGISFYAYPTE